VVAASSAHDREQPACLPVLGEIAQREGGRAAAPDQVGQERGGMALLDETQVEQEVR
jgi:hypothetical protein